MIPPVIFQLPDTGPYHDLVMAWTAIMVLVIAWKLYRVVERSTLEWEDLISTLGKDGRMHLNIDKMGKVLGVVLCFWLPIVYAYSQKMEATGLALVMFTALAYLGAVGSYELYIRSRQGLPPPPPPEPVTTTATATVTTTAQGTETKGP